MRITRLAAAAVAASLAACAGAPPPPPPKPVEIKREEAGQELFDKGVKALQAKTWDAARDAFAKAARKDPQLANAHYNLGVVHEQLGDLASAQAAYVGVL